MPRAVEERHEALVEFEALLDRSEKLRVRGLGFDELRQLARLYRRHSAELARLRDRGGDPDAIRHQNALCVRAYALLYAPAGRRPRADGFGYREALRRSGWAVALAFTLLGLGGLVGGGLAARDPAALYAFMPVQLGYEPEFVERLWSSPEERQAFLAREETPASRNALFGSWLFTHNTRVGLLSFATGMLAAVPTVLLQLYNGIVLGAFAAIFVRDPRPVEFWAWILPHGVPELTAICLCCAAGLVLGAAVVAPGRRTRRAALREAGTQALLLFATSVPLFFCAALVESFVRESTLGTATRLAVAAGGAVTLLAVALWAFAGRRGDRRAAAAWIRSLARNPSG
ncbi:MAG: stage II sporulation protein M [Proteobacteria bacterium]|nr:stage II sporulation protein M [Pseudomonadota bacterium]